MRLFPPTALRAALLLSLLLLLPACQSLGSGDGNTMTEQLLLVATAIGSFAALPVLIQFIVEHRKRKERLALSLDDVRVSTLHPDVAGLEPVLEDIADLIDRAGNPREYASVVKAGNEILIIAGNLLGKKALARAIAQRARLSRLITVHNPRNADALAKARSLIGRCRKQKVMLLLAGLDSAYARDDEDILAELDALVEATSNTPNVLVVGTALRLEPNSPLDNAFGVKLVLPGTPHIPAPAAATAGEMARELRQLLSSVLSHYWAKATASGFTLEGLTEEAFFQTILEVVTNPAEVQDILALCQTAAIYRHRCKGESKLAVTPAILSIAIRRVVTGTVIAQGALVVA